ncbi:LuxR C-terminal-related transcriptional regulator [Aeromicrobium sp. PE09-221]|uniref:LuxR C-terminal-related transcriptional regulator n=1 Tax=Aeromicrobium sp. PE09-221 TaxID=1898043 RepID=UPI001482EF1A|nr:LuxR C-terminal-related transcriptional regulator [Aeromicrobium sp. PE09-221]
MSPDVAAERLGSLVADETEGATLLIGDHGLGKSHVLQLLAREHTALTVRAVSSEHEFALSGIDAFISVLHPAMAHQLGHHLSLRDGSDGGLYAAAHDVLDIIGGLRLPPTLVLVDDLDIMDAQSLAILTILLAHLGGTGVRVIAAVTRVPTGMESLPSLQLGPLSADAAERLLRESGPVDATTGRLLLDYSGGHPAVLLHQLSALDRRQRSGRRPLVLPMRWTSQLDAIVPRVTKAFSSAEQEILLTVALAPACPLDVLVETTGNEELIAELIDEGVLTVRGDDISVEDQNLRAALLRRSTRPDRIARHTELVERLRTLAPELASWHRGFLSTSPAAAPDLLDAAADAAEAGQLRVAVELAETAYARLSGETSGSLQAHARLVWALQRAGESALAARYTRWARAQHLDATTELALATAELTATLVSGQRMYDEDVEAVIALHGERHPDEAARLCLILAAGHLARCEPTPARAALATGRRIITQPRLGDVADALTDVADALDDHRRMPGRPQRPTDPPEALVLRAHAASMREDYGRARRLLTSTLHHPGLRERSLMTVSHLIGVRNELAAGDFTAAQRAIDLWAADPPWIRHDSSTTDLVVAWHHYITGDIGAAHQAIAQCLELAARESHPANRATALALRGAIHLMTGDPGSAVADLRATTVLSHDAPRPSLLRHWGDYVEACVLTDRVSEARRAAASLERLLSRYPSQWGDHVLARAKGLVSADASVTLLAEHVTSLDESALHSYEGARSLVCLADRQAEVGRTAEAQRTAANAATIFDSIGATGWAAHLRLRPYREPAPVPAVSPLAALSSAEQEIVQLVREGLRNREIAERLYVSVRTVELRLTHVYRALDVRSRTELTALLGERHDAA